MYWPLRGHANRVACVLPSRQWAVRVDPAVGRQAAPLVPSVHITVTLGWVPCTVHVTAQGGRGAWFV
jgi:hypothetical protein